MKVFTYSEARQNLSRLLILAQKEEVDLTRKKVKAKSPFDVSGIKTKATTQDIMDAVRDSRRG
jgi:hypothetical protein